MSSLTLIFLFLFLFHTHTQTHRETGCIKHSSWNCQVCVYVLYSCLFLSTSNNFYPVGRNFTIPALQVSCLQEVIGNPHRHISKHVSCQQTLPLSHAHSLSDHLWCLKKWIKSVMHARKSRNLLKGHIYGFKLVFSLPRESLHVLMKVNLPLLLTKKITFHYKLIVATSNCTSTVQLYPQQTPSKCSLIAPACSVCIMPVCE